MKLVWRAFLGCVLTSNMGLRANEHSFSKDTATILTSQSTSSTWLKPVITGGICAGMGGAAGYALATIRILRKLTRR